MIGWKMDLVQINTLMQSNFRNCVFLFCLNCEMCFDKVNEKRNISTTNGTLSDLLLAFIVILLCSACWPDSEFKANRYFLTHYYNLQRTSDFLHCRSYLSSTLWKIMNCKVNQKSGEMLQVHSPHSTDQLYLWTCYCCSWVRCISLTWLSSLVSEGQTEAYKYSLLLLIITVLCCGSRNDL